MKYTQAKPLLLGGYQEMLARKDRIGARTNSTWIAPAHGSSNSIRRAARRGKLPSGEKK
jgi:hypothetical protein